MSHNSENVAILWDIDGTLLDTQGVAARQLERSYMEVTGLPCSILLGQYSGFTDFEIVLDLLKHSGTSPKFAKVEEILLHYGLALSDKLLQNPPKLLADIKSIFYELANLGYVQNFIATGNSMLGAQAKIRSTNLHIYFPFKSYFVSSPSNVSRDSVIATAVESINIPKIVVGDSKRDILSAKSNQLKVLAVATGHHSFKQLEELKPDYLLNSNWKSHEFISVISNFADNLRR